MVKKSPLCSHIAQSQVSSAMYSFRARLQAGPRSSLLAQGRTFPPGFVRISHPPICSTYTTKSAMPKRYSNSSHPLNRLPNTSVRVLVVTMMRPFSLSNRVMSSWTPSAFVEKSPSREAKPTSRSFVTNTAP